MNQIKYYLPLNILIAEPSKSPAKALNYLLFSSLQAKRINGDYKTNL